MVIWMTVVVAFGGKLRAMPRHSSKGIAAKSKEQEAKEGAIPPEVAQLINGQSVSIDPRRYLSNVFRAALPLIQHRLKESPANTFNLEPKLFEEFLDRLRSCLEKKTDPVYARFQPSDWVAFALVSLVPGKEVSGYADPEHYWEHITTPPEGYWEHISLPSSLIGSGNQPGATPAPGSDQQNSNRVSLNVAFGSESFPNEAFALEITIEGEPLRPFYDLEGDFKMTLAERRALQRRAKAIWSFLNEKISSRLGIARLEPGRSLTDQGGRSAFLHDHFGYSWARVAQELCKDQRCKDEKGRWKHDHWCRERFRKSAKLHWKHQAERYAARTRDVQTP